MTIEEMFRRIVRAHLGLILVCVLIPVAAVAVLEADRPTPTVASLRLQVIAGAPKSATEAEAMNSRVLAVATTPSLLQNALKAADVQRDVDTYAVNNVTAQRLGESSIVELSVSDDNPKAASPIVAALAIRVANFMNQGDQATYQETVAELSDQINAATVARDKLVAKLRGIADVTARADLGVQIQSANQLLSELTGQRANLMANEATRDHVVLIGSKPDVVQSHSSILPELALALLLGLVLGLATATIVETFRPRVSGIRALAHLLQAPVLGKASEEPGGLRNTMALAARRQGVDAVVLMGVDEGDAETVDKMLVSLAGHAPTTRKVKQTTNGRDDDVFESSGLGTFTDIRFTGLSAVTPEDEMTAGVVVVSSGMALLRRLDDLDDVLKAVRWPVLGVIEGPKKRRFASLSRRLG